MDIRSLAVGENQSRRDLTKVAQYEVLGNDAKRNARPGRDDRNVLLLVSHLQLRERKRRIDRPVRVRDGSLSLNVNPALRTGLLSLSPFLLRPAVVRFERRPPGYGGQAGTSSHRAILTP
jgi:hypothetical protein